jgi:ABC-type siderophore export system fused ATPase/permease subunit
MNIAFYDKDMTAFLSLCFIYTVILFFNQFIIATMNNLILSQLMTGFVFDIRRAIFKKVLHKKGKDLAEMYSGDMISRMNNDATDFVNLIFWSGLWGYSNVLHIGFAVLLQYIFRDLYSNLSSNCFLYFTVF